MKKRFAVLAIMAVTALTLAACGGEDAPVSVSSISISEDPVSVPTVSVSEEEPETSVEEEVVEEPVPDGMYRSELTNEFTSLELQDQRPIAVMVDNETKAYPHIGLNNADVVYEMMNSTANGRITRLMCLVKDWKNLEQFGSVRSTRPTNVMLAAEWNAILVHDGGPYYINQYLDTDWGKEHLSGGFARFSNGKNWEYSEYVTSEKYYNSERDESYAGLISRINSAGYSETYNSYYQGPHFTFTNIEKDLSDRADAIKVDELILPFPHNNSKLVYNAETKTYDYYCYGEAHIDPLDGNKVLSFKNLIVYPVSFTELDEHGYMIYNVIGSGAQGAYFTNGYAVAMHWSKASENAQTKYYDSTMGEEITLNTGKTYIALVPEDVWSEIIFN